MSDALGSRFGHLLGAPVAATGPSFGTFTLNGTADTIEWIFQAPEAITISDLGFRYGARTGTPPTYRISLQGVTGAGRADGTIKGATNNALKTFTPPADTTWNGLWQWQTLDETATVARGDLLAIEIAYSSGTVGAGNNSSFTTSLASWDSTAFPTYVENDTGTPGTSASRIAIYGYKSSSKSYGFPLEATNAVSYTSGSTPDEYALKFTLPAGWGSTFKVAGARFALGTLSTDTTNGLTMRLFDSDGSTVLQNLDIQADCFGVTSTTQRSVILYFDEVTLSTLNFGTAYRLSLYNNSGSTPVSIRTIQVDAAQELDPFPGGQNFLLSTRTDAGSWTDTTNERPLIELILEDITEPSGGASGGVGVVGAGFVVT